MTILSSVFACNWFLAVVKKFSKLTVLNWTVLFFISYLLHLQITVAARSKA
jgi:hypothetical protein